ncbi:hypothetical protein M8C21_000270, partial [Ambrosia artemisiifolia]
CGRHQPCWVCPDPYRSHSLFPNGVDPKTNGKRLRWKKQLELEEEECRFLLESTRMRQQHFHGQLFPQTIISSWMKLEIKWSTPGSVAQKKAFFEAHYKKIAAIKAKADLLLLEQQHIQEHFGDGSAAAAFQPDEVMQLGNPSEPPTTLLLTTTTAASSMLQEEAVLVNFESMNLVDLHPPQPQITLPKPHHVSPKVTPNKVEKNPIGMKKKPASLTPKSPATTLMSNPTSTSTLNKASAGACSSSSVSLSKNKNHSLSESHLSMSMTSLNSDTASSSVTSSRRPSLFMEQMGDKDILPIKRSISRKAPAAAAAEKINPATGKLEPTWKSVSSGSPKGVGVDERRLKAGPTSVALKSNERRKEFLKKLEEKSIARKSEVSLKSKAPFSYLECNRVKE